MSHEKPAHLQGAGAVAQMVIRARKYHNILDLLELLEWEDSGSSPVLREQASTLYCKSKMLTVLVRLSLKPIGTDTCSVADKVCR